MPNTQYLIPNKPAVIFCDTLCYRLRDTHLLDGVLLYVVRTFLIAEINFDTAIDR